MKLKSIYNLIKENSDLGANYSTDLLGIKRVITKSTGITDIYFAGKKISMNELKTKLNDSWDKFGSNHPATYRFDGSDLLVSWKI